MTKEKFYEEERKLIEKAKGGDRKAMEDLMDRYEPLFRKLCAGETRMDWEDIRQDLAVSFLEGVRAFTPERGTYFPYYIRQRLYWEKVHLVERMMRRRSVELQSLAGIENIADESEGGRDHLEVLKEIAADLPLSKKERDLLSALLRGEKAADVRKTMNMSRASYYRLRAVSVKFSSVIHLTVDNYYLRGFGFISISV